MNKKQLKMNCWMKPALQSKQPGLVQMEKSGGLTWVVFTRELSYSLSVPSVPLCSRTTPPRMSSRVTDTGQCCWLLGTNVLRRERTPVRGDYVGSWLNVAIVCIRLSHCYSPRALQGKFTNPRKKIEDKTHHLTNGTKNLQRLKRTLTFLLTHSRPAPGHMYFQNAVSSFSPFLYLTRTAFCID